VRFGRSRSFRVIQGRWFLYQSKVRIRLPISPSLWLHVWSYLAPFLRYGDLLAKNCLFLLHFCYPSLIRRPRSLCSLWNFALKLTVRKLKSWGYPPVKAHDRSWSRFGMIPACDRRLDRQSDGRTESIMANTALCTASCKNEWPRMTSSQVQWLFHVKIRLLPARLSRSLTFALLAVGFGFLVSRMKLHYCWSSQYWNHISTVPQFA